MKHILLSFLLMWICRDFYGPGSEQMVAKFLSTLSHSQALMAKITVDWHRFYVFYPEYVSPEK